MVRRLTPSLFRSPMSQRDKRNMLMIASIAPGLGIASALVRSPMVLGQVIKTGTQVAAGYAAIAPVMPWVKSGGPWSKTHGVHIGFGYEGQTVKFKNTPGWWFVGRYMGGTPSGRWVGNLVVPTFGFGYGSHQLHPASIQVETSTSRGGQFRPSSSQQVRRTGGPSAQKASGFGRSPSARRRPIRRAKVSRRGSTPWCKIHKRRHWCRYTRK